MTGESTYQAAKSVAPFIAEHFAQQLQQARHRGEEIVLPQPEAAQIETMIDVAFWASLRKEEGHPPKISLALLPPDLAGQPLLFSHHLPLTPEVLTKLGAGVERAGIHVGVWTENDKLYVWGTTRQILSTCFVLDVSEPGLLVIKHRRLGGFGKFVNVAVLKGEQVKIIDENHANIPDCPAVLSSLLGFTSISTWTESVNVMVQLAVSMRSHGRGGTLLVVPESKKNWADSIVQPMQYAIKPIFSALANLMEQSQLNRRRVRWRTAVQNEIESLAGLTAIDGATIITDRYALLAFGAKIGISAGNQPVDEILVSEPVVGGRPMLIPPSQNGGTRHLSAAQFVYDQRDGLALVASQDGRFTIFSWSPCDNLVHAYRIETLLL